MEINPCRRTDRWRGVKKPNSFLVHSTHIYLPMKMEQTGCSETSAYKLQTPGNYPKENIQHTQHGESLKSRKTKTLLRVRTGSRVGALV